MNAHGWFNAIEAGAWIAMGLFLGVCARFVRPELRSLALIAGIALVVFGGTDIIEIFTGAWYEPLGLLALNAICIAVLFGCYMRYRKLSQVAADAHRDTVSRG